MPTPIPTDQFTRFMAEVFNENEIIGVDTAGQSFFGNPANNMSRTVYSPDSKVIDIDIMRGTERIAALIPRGTVSRHMGNLQKNTDTQNFTTFSRTFPLAEETGDINADEILDRLAGENPYAGRMRRDRLREKAREHYMEHIRRFTRLFEVLAWSSLLDGQQPAILGTTNTDLIYNWHRSSTHSVDLTGSEWDAAGADILENLDDWCELVRQDGKQTPNFIAMAGDVIKAFLEDTTIQAYADNRRYNLVTVSTENPVPSNLQPLIAGGMTAYGKITTPRGYTLWIFTYVGDYVNAAGTRTKYLPDGRILLGYYGARCDRYFGPPERLPLTSAKAAWFQELFGFNMMAPPMPAKIKNQGAVITPGMFFIHAYSSNDDKKVSISTQTAPIFATTQTDSFLSVSNVISGDAS